MSKVIDFETLNKLKFDCIDLFGILPKTRKHEACFFIWNKLSPVQYGADCRDLECYDIELKTADDYVVLADFIKNLFGESISTAPKEAVRDINNLMKHFKETIHPVQWGACELRYIPFNPAFRKDAAVTIELSDNVPGIVIEPLELPERSIPEDWDI